MVRLTGSELVEHLLSPFGVARLIEDGPLVLVTDLATGVGERQGAAVAALAGLPLVVAAVDVESDPGPWSGADLCDVVVLPEAGGRADGADGDGLAGLVEAVTAHPTAAVSLAVLLRAAPRPTLGQGLAAESAVYSLLQSGPEFARWRASRPRPARPDLSDSPSVAESAVVVSRVDDVLHVTLNRPAVHNAFNSTMRDQLIEAATLVAADSSLRTMVLDGAGPSFCSGGDLDEFGSFGDPASAHVVRLAASAARSLGAVADRLEVHLHGHCLGSGIELAALASRVVARPDVRIGLPEIGLGLIPGAGGTQSLPVRIGRHRTAYLALCGARLDADTALAWGLVDVVEP
jgi:hypothetical protein